MADNSKNQKINIILRSFDHKLLDVASKQIVMTAKKSGVRISGPIPMPLKINDFTVIRSPHIDKKSREQFELRIQKRLIVIEVAKSDGFMKKNDNIIDSLMKVELSAGVDVKIKIIEEKAKKI